MGSLEINSPFRDEPVEFIFLGTGTSSTVPHVDCLTAPPEATPCKTCTSTLYPEGKKNIRVRTYRLLQPRTPELIAATSVLSETRLPCFASEGAMEKRSE